MTTGIFTTIKIKNKIPLFFEAHQIRLLTQAKKLKLKPPTQLNKKIINYLDKNNLTDCALKVTLKNNISITSRPLPKVNETIKLITVKDQRNKYKVYKTTNRIENEKAKKLAEENNSKDALFVNDGKLIESTISNIFSINKKGQIITPPINDKGLKGITRELLIQKLNVVEEEIPDDCSYPIVLTNCLRIQKASHLNGKKLPNAERLFKKIKNALEKEEDEYLQKRGGFNIYFQKFPVWIDPEQVFTKLFADASKSFWLDSSLTNQNSRFSYMGTPEQTVTYDLKTNTITVQKNKMTKQIQQNIFDYLQNELNSKKINIKKLPFPFIGGYVGFLGYELKSITGAKNKYQSPYPDSLWYYTTQFIAFDHLEKKVYLVCLTKNKIDAEKWFTLISKNVNKSNLKKFPTLHSIPLNNEQLNFKLDRNHQQYLQDIAKCKEYLKKGESYQICLTNKLTAKANLDPLKLYLKIRKENPAPFASFIKYHDLAILCSSPEEFLKIDQSGIIETKPIKGTIKRGKTPAENKKLINELTGSKKDWSENAMIVDLLRNDLGKICEFGSVKIIKLMDIESYQSVHQLVSTIKGKLKKDATIIDCIKACFPGGSMTGAPKIKTMEILENLEKKARGIYSGSIGFLSLNHTANLSIIIRTIIMHKNKIEIGAGGAILMDSIPEKEYEEMLLKANVLMQCTSALYNPTMHKIFLALGSNVGNKKGQIRSAIELLGEHVKNIALAKFYETKPMYFENQGNFINTALMGKTDLSPEKLLEFVKSIEKKLGRQERFRNGPREIDIDILFYDDLILKKDNLEIPHPLIQEREFVLKPLRDLDPMFIHPILKKSIKEI